MLSKNVFDQKDPKVIGAWIFRLNVVAAIRLLVEDLDLIKRADIFGVESLGKQINKPNSKSDTVLHLAAAARNDHAVLNLLMWGANVNPSVLGCFPEGNEKEKDPTYNILKRMVPINESDASVLSQGDMIENGWTPLMVAAEIGDTVQIDVLLKQGNSINITNGRQRSALHIACSAGKSEAVKLLVERGVNLEDKDKNGLTALCCAAQGGCVQSIRTLVEKRADLSVVCKPDVLSTNFETVLDLAVRSGEIECIKLLKGYGVDGWTSLMVAVETGPYCVKQILDTRKNLIRLRSGRAFRTSFQEALFRYSNLTMLKTWKWGMHEEKNLVLSNDCSKVSKISDTPDYSCVLGDLVFSTGIHRWTLRVQNVNCMWAGVAHRVTKDQLSIYPGDRSGDGCSCCIVFGSRPSDVRVYGHYAAEITFLSQSGYSQLGYSDNQTLDFELDMYDRSLKFSVNGVLAVVASNLNVGEMEPYVCMDYSESVELVASASSEGDGRTLKFEDNIVQDIDFSPKLIAELLQYSPHTPAVETSTSILQPCVGGVHLCLLLHLLVHACNWFTFCV